MTENFQKRITAYLQFLESKDNESGTYYSLNFFVENDIELMRHNDYSKTHKIIVTFDSIDELFNYIENEVLKRSID